MALPFSNKKSIDQNGVQRVEFAHTLRGLAALSVLISHYLGVFWMAPDAVASLLNVPSLNISPPRFIIPLHFSAWLNYGSLGVAVFFLISGFVIPFSLNNLSRTGFIIARIFRIYPVYIFSFSISLFGLYILNILLNRSLPYSFGHILIQIFLLRGWLWIPSIDGVSWTLEIEIVFYIIVACFAPIILKTEGRFIAIYSLSILFINISVTSNIEIFPPQIVSLALYVTFALPFTLYMFIGTLFFLSAKKQIGSAQLIQDCSLAIFSFFISFATHPSLKTVPTSSYLIALLIFLLFFLSRESFKSNRFLDWLADISYPLYAVHALTGYTLMYSMISLGFSPIIVAISAFSLAIFLAWSIHSIIEIQTTKFGKKLPPLCSQ